MFNYTFLMVHSLTYQIINCSREGLSSLYVLAYTKFMFSFPAKILQSHCCRLDFKVNAGGVSMNISLSGVTVVIVRTQDMLQPLSISTPLPPHPTLITTLITHQTMLSCSFYTCVYTDQCIFLEFNIICGTGSSIADPSLPGCVSYQHSREDASW